MGKLTGFIEYVRETNPMRPEEERVKDWKEVYVLREEKTCETQGALYGLWSAFLPSWRNDGGRRERLPDQQSNS